LIHYSGEVLIIVSEAFQIYKLIESKKPDPFQKWILVRTAEFIWINEISAMKVMLSHKLIKTLVINRHKGKAYLQRIKESVGL
jgi:hypothetical protein